MEIDNGLEAMGKLAAAVVRDGSQVHLPLDALAVRRPVLADHQVRADPLARPPPRLPARRPRPAEADRRARPRRGHLDLPGRHRGARDAAREAPPRRSRCSRRSPTSPACATGRTRASTSTTSPTRSRSRKSRSWSARARVEWARPPISPEFLMPRTRRDAREALDVPAHARMVLVSGGGWGVGDLERRDRARRSPTATPRWSASPAATRSPARSSKQRFADNERVRVLGFTEQMSDWMAAADAMIHATAGLTVLEAHIRGCPVDLLRLLGRPPARQQRRLRTLRPRRGGALRARAGVDPAPRHPRAPLARLLLRLAALDRLAGAHACARGCASSRSGACARRAPSRSPSPARSSPSSLVISAVHRESPLKPLTRSPAGSTAGIHIGKDNDTTGPAAIVARRRRGSRRRSPPTDAAAAADAAALDRAPSPGRARSRSPSRSRTPARRWRRSCPRLGRRAAGRAARGGRRGRRPHLRRRPAPAGHAGGAGDPARGRRRRRPSSSPASRSSGGRRWSPRSSPPATGSSCTATATATSCG